MAVVKANGYGHGLLRIAGILGNHVDAFAVATVEEAVSLTDSDTAVPVCVLSGFHSPEHVAVFQSKPISCVIYCAEQIDLLQQAQHKGEISVWIKVDTGMHRLGFPIEELTQACATVRSIPNVRIAGVMSHFACADELVCDFTKTQLDRFNRCTGDLDIERSIANSAGIVGWPDSHLDWVRPGIMLYGASPIADQSAESLGLRPVMNLYSTVIAINQLNAGEAIGYGLTWKAARDMRVGIVGCGYGDGYFRSASSRAKVLIDGTTADVIGRVSMDMLAVDLSSHPDIRVGTRVKLFGDGLPVEQLADAVGTIPYEILTSVNARSVAFIEE